MVSRTIPEIPIQFVQKLKQFLFGRFIRPRADMYRLQHRNIQPKLPTRYQTAMQDIKPTSLSISLLSRRLHLR